MAEWEKRKDMMKYLFIDNGRTLVQVRDIMAKQYDFDRTYVSHEHSKRIEKLTVHSPSQYELKFKKWGFRKNLSGKEWKELGAVVEATGSVDRLFVVGTSVEAISGQRARKLAHRHKYETTWERIQRERSMDKICTGEKVKKDLLTMMI